MPRPAPVLLLEEEGGNKERILTRWSDAVQVEQVIIDGQNPENGGGGGGNGNISPRSPNRPPRRHLPDPLSISYEAMCITQMFLERRSPLNKTPSSPLTSPGNQYPWRFGKTLFDNPFQVLSDIQRRTM